MGLHETHHKFDDREMVNNLQMAEVFLEVDDLHVDNICNISYTGDRAFTCHLQK